LRDIFWNKYFLLSLIVGLFIAESVLSMWTALEYDMNIWFNTGAWLSQGINIYLPNDHLGYPPLWAFWCLIAYRAYGVLGNNMEAWRLIIKLPLILAQFALAFAITKFAQTRFNKATAQKIFLLTLTGAFFIYISAIWGQINMLSALLTFLAFYAVVSKRNSVGAVLLGVAVALKIYPLIVLPAFAAFLWKNQSRREAAKFTLYACMLPTVFTLAVFSVYQWDLIYFMRTVFYWTPVSQTVIPQIQGGCMNFFSFTNLLHLDIGGLWLLRYIWIPITAVTALYWFRKPSLKEPQFNLAIISLYLVFMLSYSWVTEQTFLDPLPFIFLQIFAYNPKKIYTYALIFTQVAIFGFITFNGGPLVFKPLLQQFWPQSLLTLEGFDPKYPLIWSTRGIFGLIVSLALCVFLAMLAKPQAFERIHKTLKDKFGSAKQTLTISLRAA
jgi:hypothetical protein